MRGRGAHVKRADGLSASSAKLTLEAQRFARRTREKTLAQRPTRRRRAPPFETRRPREARAASVSQVHVSTYSFGISPLRRTALANTFPARRENYRNIRKFSTVRVLIKATAEFDTCGCCLLNERSSSASLAFVLTFSASGSAGLLRARQICSLHMSRVSLTSARIAESHIVSRV